jgi:hypothetical protein
MKLAKMALSILVALCLAFPLWALHRLLVAFGEIFEKIVEVVEDTSEAAFKLADDLRWR